jgi:O-antigen ligase
MGFGLAVLAVAQAATPGRQIYWLFPTELESPLPFGPFANRNHFASWVIMAIPLSLGYLAARGVPPLRRQPGRRTSLDDLDERAIWLSAAVAAMLLALLLSLSRSGALGLVVSGVATLVLTRRARNGGHQRHLAAMLALAMVLSVSWADLPTVRDRLTGAPRELVDRVVIWTDTLPMLRDAWATGVGAGAYETGMRVYQASDRTIYFNQAHNHYLQAAAEGGLLLLSALACAMWAFVRAAREQIKADRSSVWWIRVGAASGLAAVALQSALETGLVMSANSALAAVLAAIVVHDPRRASASAGVRSDPPASLPGHGFVILPSRSPSLPASRRG